MRAFVVCQLVLRSHRDSLAPWESRTKSEQCGVQTASPAHCSDDDQFWRSVAPG